MQMSAGNRSKRKTVQSHWQWNLPLLVRSLCAAAAMVALAIAVYFWQSSSMASELLTQAKNSADRGEGKEQVKWLSRYVRMVPNDVQRQADLAFAVDEQEVGPDQNVEFACSRLAVAIVASGVDPEFEDLRKSLKRKLIPRLLQFGVSRAQEAETNILSLDADPNDANATKWLAQALFFQWGLSEYEARDPNQFDKANDYWKWLASQPAGQVLRSAMELNPNDVDLAQSYLFVVSNKPAWFGANLEAVEKEKIQAIAKETVDRLIASRESGQAQLVAYSNLLTNDPERAKKLLAKRSNRLCKD